VAECDAGDSAVQPAQLSRRMIIGLGLAAPTLAVPWLAGCSGDSAPPVVPSPAASESSPAGSPAPSASQTAVEPDPSALAAPEQGLAVLAAAILVGPHRKQLSKDRRNLLSFLRNAHTAHARAIADPPPSQAPANLGRQSLDSSLALLARRESAAGGRYRHAALRAEGADALLWGSLSLSAASFARALGSADPPSTRSVADRKPVEILSDVAAVQELVRQLHAIVYGYQLAIGKMKVLSRQRPKAERELLNERIFRDQLIAWLRKRSAEVPAAEPAYVPSVIPRNPATAGKLIMQMQTALQPFCGLWLAAADSSADREQALTALDAAMTTARFWGAPLTAWPGWST
jgi:hypothetical protein